MDTKDPIALLDTVTDRHLSALRLVLAAGGVLIIYLVSLPQDSPSPLTYTSLLAYVAYSLVVYLMSRRRGNFSGPVLQGLVWADVAWYTLLTSLSHGTNSLYFFYYLFAIVVASSRVGFRFAALVTAVSAGVYVMSGFVAVPPGTYDMVRLTTRPLAILGLGLILAYWGGAESVLKRRLALLNELSVVANPRFGVDWTIELIQRRLLGFWNASQCLILLNNETGMSLYLVTRDEPNRSRKVPVASPSEVPFIDASDPAALIYNERQRVWAGTRSLQSYDPRTNIIGVRPPAPGEALAEFLAAHSFVSVPLHYRERYRGRIVVSSERTRAFDVHDAMFLQQVANQALPVIENIRLVERLALDASEEERNRIARSVHDRVIQPYYGLQMGLKALHSALERHGGDSADNSGKEAGSLLSELMAMTSDGIDELRQYVSGLKQSRNGNTHLADSIRRFASKFEQATGIHVNVTDRTEGFAGNELLTSEVFQMAAEALSNVHRHTQARSARVTLELREGAIQLQVENDRNGDSELPRFTPGSISDRAEALGGKAEVQLEEGRTVLRVQVPL